MTQTPSSSAHIDRDNLELSHRIAQFSKDPSTKVGAIFFDAHKTTPIVWGYNGMPRGMNDEDVAKNTRPEKYFWYEHAERNAIYNAAQPMMILNHAIALCSDFPSMEGARALVSAGIHKIYVLKEEGMTPSAQHDFQRVEELCRLTDVSLEFIHAQSIGKTAQKYYEFLQLALAFGQTHSHLQAHKPSGTLILNEKTRAPLAFGARRGPPMMNPSLGEQLNALSEKQPSDLNHSLSLSSEKEIPEPWWIQDPEKDAIFGAARPRLNQSCVYVSWCPCMHCALALASVGVRELITHEIDVRREADLRWEASFRKTHHLLSLMGIALGTEPYKNQ